MAFCLDEWCFWCFITDYFNFCSARYYQKCEQYSHHQIKYIADAKDLSTKITIENTKDELAQISHAINGMVDSFASTIHQTINTLGLTNEQSKKLDNVIVSLGKSIQHQEVQIADMNILVCDVGAQLDIIEEASVGTTEDFTSDCQYT